MPNHITNILKISGSQADIEKCLSSIKGVIEEDGENSVRPIDFNKIIPMPKSMHITSGSSVDNAVAILKDDEKYFKGMLDYPWVKEEGLTTTGQIKEHLMGNLSEKDFEEGRTAIENMNTYGCKDWYSWSIQNWGTKWNAYDQIEVGFGTIQFDTAWSTPFPVVQKLARMFPELDFEVKFADEDLGSNCGTYLFEGGILVNEYQPEGTEALKFACEVKDYEFENIIFDNFSYWDLSEIRKHEDTIVAMLKGDYASRLLDEVDLATEEGREKAEYLKRLAVENEIYEEAGYISQLLGNE
jgi:hypothetical protein